MRVAQPREHPSFREELLLEHVGVFAVRRERLESVANAELLMLHFIDGAHSALAEKTHYTIRADLLPWRENANDRCRFLCHVNLPTWHDG